MITNNVHVLGVRLKSPVAHFRTIVLITSRANCPTDEILVFCSRILSEVVSVRDVRLRLVRFGIPAGQVICQLCVALEYGLFYRILELRSRDDEHHLFDIFSLLRRHHRFVHGDSYLRLGIGWLLGE